MKKMMICVLVMMLICALALPAMATQTPQMTITVSDASVKRGDTVEITVSISEVKNCTSVGIGLSYDTGAFEMVEGSYRLLVSNTSTDSFKYVANAKSYLAKIQMSGEQTVSGKLFSFSLKVKDDAMLNTSFAVSGTPSLRIDNAAANCSVNGVNIKVVCSHSYDNDCDTSCNICGETRTASHTWNSGEVTTAATCTAEGVKTYTCTVCGKTKTEAVSKLSHSYESKVTKEATCTSAGEKVFTCSGCGKSYTEAVAKLAHDYDNDCDADCNACGANRSVTHKYRSAWSSDGNGHWHACSVCGDRKDEAEHTPGAEPTEWNPQVCTVCDYVIRGALGHTHTFESEYTTDEDGHWFACTGCDEKHDYYDHTFDNDCDPDCEHCGYVREIEHNYSNRLSFSEEGHWYECTVCGDMLEIYPHNPGPEATEETDQICMDCGYVLQPAGAHEHFPAGDWLSDAQGHWYQCSCGEHYGNAEHTWGEGVVDQEANTETHHCTVCGYPRVTQLPDPTNPTESQPETEPTEGTTQTPPETKPQGGGEQQEPDDGFPWWILVVIVLVLLIGGVVFVIIGILVSKKQTGKYS